MIDGNIGKQLLEELEQAAATNLPRIHESTFRARLLPLIDTDKEDIRLDDWFAVAGNPHQRIEVVDEANNVLFVVPGILTPLPLLVADSDVRNTVNAVLSEFDALRTTTHPAVSDAYLHKELSERLDRSDDREMARALIQWRLIDMRYDLKAARFAAIKSLVLPEQAADDPKPGNASASDSSGEFEEL